MVTAVVGVPKIVSIDDAVEAVWELVFAGEEKSTADAAHRLWPDFRFSSEALHMLALEGFIDRCNSDQEMRRRNGKAPIAYGVPHGRDWDDYLKVLATPYRGADATKPLLEFTITDLAAWAVYNKTLAQSYAERAKWAGKVEGLLEEHGAVKVGKLPKAVLKEISDELAEIVQL